MDISTIAGMDGRGGYAIVAALALAVATAILAATVRRIAGRDTTSALAEKLAEHIRVDFSDMTPGTPITGVPYAIALAYGASLGAATTRDVEYINRELAACVGRMSADHLDRIEAMASRLSAAVVAERGNRPDRSA